MSTENLAVPALRDWRMSLPEGRRSLRVASLILGVGTVQLYRYESGQNRIPAESVPRISELTGIPPEVLRPDVYAVIRQAG